MAESFSSRVKQAPLTVNRNVFISPTTSASKNSAGSHAEKPNPKATEHHLSNAARARIHKYHKWSRTISAFVGIAKFATICLETVHVLQEAKAAPPPGEGPHLALPVSALITSSVAFVGSIGQVCIWQWARDNDEVREHLDHFYWPIFIGATVGTVGNAVSVLACVVRYSALKAGKADLGSTAALVSGCALCIASLGETIGVHLIPAIGSSESGQGVSIMLGGFECAGTVGGLGAVLGAKARDPNITGIGVSVDGLFTFCGALTGLVTVLTDEEDAGH